MRTRVALLLLATSTACGGPREARRVDPPALRGDPGPRDVPEVHVALPEHELPLTALPGAPVVRVRSIVAPVVTPGKRPGEAVVRARLDLGREVECVVRADRLDAATVLRALVVADVKPWTGQARVTLEKAAPAGVPVLMALARSADGVVAAHAAVANVGDRSTACRLVGLPATANFREVVLDLAASLSARSNGEGARLHHWVETTDGWLGVAEHVQRRREDGVTMDISFASLVRARDGGMDSVDHVSVEVTDAEGALAMWRIMRTDNGVLALDTQVGTAPGGRTRLEGRGVPAVDLGKLELASLRQLRGMAAAVHNGIPPPSTPFLRFFPGMDARGVAEERVRVVENSGGTVVLRSDVSTGDRSFHAEYQVEPGGTVTWSRIHLPHAVMSLRRVDADEGAR